VQSVRHAQLDGVRVDQHVARVTQVADESHYRLEASSRRRRHCGGNCKKNQCPLVVGLMSKWVLCDK